MLATPGKTLKLIVTLTMAALYGSPAAYAQPANSTELTRHCNECHGVDGIALKPGLPHLNGQLDYILVEMFRLYQQRKRPTEVEAHRQIPEGDIPLLAKHYAQQKATRPKQTTNPEMVTHGEKIYLNRCADCHLDNGRESDKEAPLTAGQDFDYLIKQTMAFKTGERKFAFLMDDAYRDLSDHDLASVAHFFAAQEQFVPKQVRRRRR